MFAYVYVYVYICRNGVLEQGAVTARLLAGCMAGWLSGWLSGWPIGWPARGYRAGLETKEF